MNRYTAGLGIQKGLDDGLRRQGIGLHKNLSAGRPYLPYDRVGTAASRLK